jgi:hypothetical protein
MCLPLLVSGRWVWLSAPLVILGYLVGGVLTILLKLVLVKIALSKSNDLAVTQFESIYRYTLHRKSLPKY